MLPQQQQQPGTPIKAATAPGAASPSSFASGAQGVHRRNLASLGGPAPFGLTVFWVVISILGSILQVAGLVRKGGGGRERKKKKGLFRRKKQLDKLIDLDLSTSKKKKKKKLLRPLSSPTRTATESRISRSRPTTRGCRAATTCAGTGGSGSSPRSPSARCPSWPWPRALSRAPAAPCWPGRRRRRSSACSWSLVFFLSLFFFPEREAKEVVGQPRHTARLAQQESD